jgi:hypothetical protein
MSEDDLTVNEHPYPHEQMCEQCGVVRPCFVHDFPPAPVVAEVRRVPIDLRDFQERAAKAGIKVRFTGFEVESLLAEVYRLRQKVQELEGAK